MQWESSPPAVRALGRWLRDEIAATGLTHARLGARISCHGSTVSRACSGRAAPRWGQVAAIVLACRADVDMARRLWEAASEAQQACRARAASGWPPAEIRTLDELSTALRQLWMGSGLSQRAIADADETGWLGRSTMGAALRGSRRPTRGLTEALVRACGGDERSVAAWLTVWDRLDRARCRDAWSLSAWRAYERRRQSWPRRRASLAAYQASR
ncbi:helix-turn-helix domain-containing protein [Crossiella sp. SN42]|uniref:helix-turn-helix domain-containing protein n=1 Tax=Crossiella sp. SN42 TaxID=2944808 RepID=UPI0035ABE586